MGIKLIDWSAEVKDARNNLGKGGRVYPPGPAVALIDYLSTFKVAYAHEVQEFALHELQKFGTKDIDQAKVVDFIKTTLGHVTTAVQGGKEVKDPGGWYFHDNRTSTYVLDRGFSAEWRKV